MGRVCALILVMVLAATWLGCRPPPVRHSKVVTRQPEEGARPGPLGEADLHGTAKGPGSETPAVPDDLDERTSPVAGPDGEALPAPPAAGTAPPDGKPDGSTPSPPADDDANDEPVTPPNPAPPGPGTSNTRPDGVTPVAPESRSPYAVLRDGSGAPRRTRQGVGFLLVSDPRLFLRLPRQALQVLARVPVPGEPATAVRWGDLAIAFIRSAIASGDPGSVSWVASGVSGTSTPWIGAAPSASAANAAVAALRAALGIEVHDPIEATSRFLDKLGRAGRTPGDGPGLRLYVISAGKITQPSPRTRVERLASRATALHAQINLVTLGTGAAAELSSLVTRTGGRVYKLPLE